MAADRPRRGSIRAAHWAWAVMAIGIAAALSLAPQRGHPPPLALVPLVAIAWPVGHALIWAVGRLAARGRRGVEGRDQVVTQWPAWIVVAVVGTGIVSLAGVVQLLGSLLQGRWYPYAGPVLWSAMLLASLVHGACFVALLLRKPWSRHLSALLALGWAVVLLAQLIAGCASPALQRQRTVDRPGLEQS
jgi:hypothetical protein